MLSATRRSEVTRRLKIAYQKHVTCVQLNAGQLVARHVEGALTVSCSPPRRVFRGSGPQVPIPSHVFHTLNNRLRGQKEYRVRVQYQFLVYYHVQSIRNYTVHFLEMLFFVEGVKYSVPRGLYLTHMTAAGQWLASTSVTSNPATITGLFIGSATTRSGLTPISAVTRPAVPSEV